MDQNNDSKINLNPGTELNNITANDGTSIPNQKSADFIISSSAFQDKSDKTSQNKDNIDSEKVKKENPEYNNSKLGVALLDGETVVSEVSKHPIGGLISLITGFSVSIAILIISIVSSLYLGSNSGVSSIYSGVALMLGIIICIGVLLATFIYVYLYRQNRLIVTTEKVALIRYHSIFHRKVTQLSIERVQDVTVTQIGILPRIYKYGTINIETAGEEEDCTFSFTPMPYELSKTIMDVHEKAVINTRHVV